MFRSTKRLSNPVKNMQQLASWLVFHLTRVKTEWKHAAKKRARAISTARPPRGTNLVEKWPLGTVWVLPTMVRNNTCGFNCCALLCLNQTWGFKQQTSVRLDQSEW